MNQLQATQNFSLLINQFAFGGHLSRQSLSLMFALATSLVLIAGCSGSGEAESVAGKDEMATYLETHPELKEIQEEPTYSSADMAP